MRAHVLALAFALVSLSLPAQAAKIAVFPPPVSSSVTAKEAGAFADAVAAAASRAGHDVITQQQIDSLVGIEAAKQMAGCDAGSCSSEIGQALGVALVLNVTLGEIGNSLVVTVKRTDVDGGAGKVANKRLAKGKAAKDGAFDALDALVGEVLAGVATNAATPTTTTTTPTPTTSTTSTTPAPTATAPKAAALPTLRAKDVVKAPDSLAFYDDGHGLYVAFVKDDGYGSVLFAGTKETGMLQLRAGAGASADGEGGFSRSLWDPRVSGGASLDKKGKVVTLTCGAKTTTLAPTKKPPKELTSTFYAPLWRRVGLLVGRDDALRYFVVDAKRNDDDPYAAPTDRRLYVGKKGKLVAVEAEIERDDTFGAGGIIAVVEGMTVKLGPGGGVVTTQGTDASTSLASLDLGVAGPQLYTDLKPWGEGPLGTPCDSLFP